MSFRRWLNAATIVLILAILYFSRHELVTAWNLLEQVHIWLLLLIIPLQFISYYSTGAMIFSYLRSIGELKKVRSIETAQMALELNFVNHVLPTGGVSGASYMTWRLGKLGVSSGRATLAQVVRFGATFAAFLALLLLAVLAITLDGNINRLTILVSSALASVILFGALVVTYVISSRNRLHVFSVRIGRIINGTWRHALRRKTTLLEHTVIEKFFEDLHTDYVALRGNPKVLLQPFIWGVVFNLAEVAAYFVVFLALGTLVNPAPILIAVGISSLAGFFLVTPGGAGGYEALMILFLSTAAVSASTAVAGVLLARVIMIVLTLVSGYVFYHAALKKYDATKPPV
jgi:uncharacterized protein (TIRG00374 family)